MGGIPRRKNMDAASAIPNELLTDGILLGGSALL